MSHPKNATKAVALAAGLIGWSFVTPRIPMPWRVPVQAGVGGLLVLATRAAVGLRPPRLWAGLRLGLPTAAAGATAVTASTAVPAVRVVMSTRDVPESALGWLALHIPLGTVWAEEAAFRAALPAAAGAFGSTGARLLQAVTFGLSHIADARGTGEPVAPTVLVTGIAGWLFGWLADRSGSLAAPMLAHLAI
ncbi:MAG: Rv0804 family intramembrane glutamic endopeptidase, partial [Mycobacterium sp.]